MSGRDAFCCHMTIFKSVYVLKLYLYRLTYLQGGQNKHNQKWSQFVFSPPKVVIALKKLKTFSGEISQNNTVIEV